MIAINLLALLCLFYPRLAFTAAELQQNKIIANRIVIGELYPCIGKRKNELVFVGNIIDWTIIVLLLSMLYFQYLSKRLIKFYVVDYLSLSNLFCQRNFAASTSFYQILSDNVKWIIE